MAYIPFPEDFIPYIPDIINWVMSFTPLLSYGSTVLSIRRLKSSNGFSIDICATMLISSILRIFYYINDPFEKALLRQCFIMIFIQIILLNTALKYRDENYSSKNLEIYENNWEFLYDKFIEINKNLIINDIDYFINNNNESENKINNFLKIFLNLIKRNLSLFYLFIISLSCEFIRFFDAHYIRPFKFWQWSNSNKYWRFLIFFILLMLIIQLVFYKNFNNLGLVFGSCSFLIESLLPLPQILLFKRFKTIENFKTILLLSWLGGDITKISYLFFGTDNVTLIFKIAAFFQMSLNLVITYQFFYYKNFGNRNNNNSNDDDDVIELENFINNDLNNNNNIRHSIESVQLPPIYNSKRSATFSIGSNNENSNNNAKFNNLLIRNNSLNSVVLPPIYKIASNGTIGSTTTNHSNNNNNDKYSEFDLTDQIFQNKENKNISNSGGGNNSGGGSNSGGGNKMKNSVRSRSSTINEHESINNIHRNIIITNNNQIEERDLSEAPNE